MANIKMKTGITVVMGLTVVLLLVAFVLPVGLDNLNSDETYTLEQNTSETYTVVGDFESNVTDITTGTATIDLSTSSDSTTITVDNGTTTNTTLEGENVSVSYDNTSGDVFTYEVPKGFGWSDGAKSLFGVIDLIAILGVLLLMFGWVMKQSP